MRIGAGCGSGKRSVPVTHGVIPVVTIHQVVPTLNVDLLIEKSHGAVRQQDVGPAGGEPIGLAGLARSCQLPRGLPTSCR